MDEHAEHILYVRNGTILEETPEFESFKRVAENHAIWEELRIYLEEIETYCRMLKEKLLKVNGSLLLQLCVQKEAPTFDKLAEAIHHADFSPQNEDDQGEDYKSKLEIYAATKI